MDIRKRVLKDFNKKEEDFATLREYNDYLEEIETIIFNLVNNIDIVGTNKRIEQYKKDNKEIIMKNKAKIGKIIFYILLFSLLFSFFCSGEEKKHFA